ncbi:MAG: DNA polymerase III subunit delta [Desulfitobacteriaceae bacterium]
MREIERVLKAVENGDIPKLWLWYGEEHFLLKEALQTLKGAYFREDPSGSCIEPLSAREVEPHYIVELANTFSFFENRLVIVQDVMYFQEGSTVDLEPFYAYFKDPNPKTCLLFVAESIHRGRKFYKALEQAGEVLEFTVPKRNQDWQVWVRSELRARGKDMPPEVVSYFLDWAGHKAGVLSQELDKLAVYTGERNILTRQDIEEVVTRISEATVFDLLDAIAVRSADKAVARLHEVLRTEHPLKVMTLLVRQVRLLLGTLAWREQGGNSSGLPEALGIKPFEAQKIWTQSMKLSFIMLSAALGECLSTEIALKNGGGDPAFLLEMMIVKFCLK